MQTGSVNRANVDILNDLVSEIEARQRRREQILQEAGGMPGPEGLAAEAFTAAEEHGEALDSRAARMLEIFAERSFDERFYTQRVRFELIWWVVRTKLANSVKRGLDILLCLIAIPLAAPLMLLTAAAIKLDSRGPVFFKQERVGRWGRRFQCYKFRSMHVNAEARKAELMDQNEADDVVFKMANDPRVTRVGRVIRKLSIDEIPQVFNVLRGEMSWVGPRPPVPVEVAQYAYDQFMRLNVTPGITGLQQVSGRSTLSFKRWIELDLEYIQKQSLLKDIEILIKTIPAVITGKGAF